MAKGKGKRPKHTSTGRTTIAGHLHQGTKLTPPMAAVPNLKLQSWRNDRLPEMLWAALMLQMDGGLLGEFLSQLTSDKESRTVFASLAFT